MRSARGRPAFEKGKTSERVGRKASGLSSLKGNRVAGLPGVYSMQVRLCFARGISKVREGRSCRHHHGPAHGGFPFYPLPCSRFTFQRSFTPRTVAPASFHSEPQGGRKPALSHVSRWKRYLSDRIRVRLPGKRTTGGSASRGFYTRNIHTALGRCAV